MTYFLLVTKVGINERIDKFSSMVREIEEAEFCGDVASLNTIKLNKKSRREFREALDGDIYQRLPKARMALMLRLEALMSDGSKNQEYRYLSLEHVLPQSPDENSQWIDCDVHPHLLPVRDRVLLLNA